MTAAAHASTLAESPVPRPLLEVVDLATRFSTPRGTVAAVDHVSLRLERGRTLGIVGESGSGKSVLLRSVMGLLPRRGVERGGVVRLGEQELTGMSAKDLARTVWGARVGLVPQDPMTALNPVVRIGRQVTEVIRRHEHVVRAAARRRAGELLRSVGIPDPLRRLRQYPHELSGGMRQRVAIAMAIACDPELLLADEPTTALDVTVQAQILDLLGRVIDERAMSMILVSHDLAVVAGWADEVAVMYAGRIVEQAPTAQLFAAPRMPYTDDLLRSIPRLTGAEHRRLGSIAGAPPDLAALPAGCHYATRCRRVEDDCRASQPALQAFGDDPRHHAACWHPLDPTTGGGRRDVIEVARPAIVGASPPSPGSDDGDALLEIDGLVVDFPTRAGRVHAVSGVSIALRRGETLGIVGESGCGKSTLARAALRAVPSRAGSVRFAGHDLAVLGREELRRIRPRLQLVFQDPTSSLNPRRRVRNIVAEAIDIWERDTPDRDARVDAALREVGLDPAVVGERRPHELSGGQCQRVSIARALVARPDVLVCDEVVSALDVSVQAQILNLLADLKREYGLTLLFIAHDLAVVSAVSDRVAVMYLGKLCEVGPASQVFAAPAHHYSAALIAAVPSPDPATGARRPPPVAGEPPSPLAPPSGCRFRTRCPRAEERCALDEPPLRPIHGEGESDVGERWVACHFPVLPVAGWDDRNERSP